jgi:hypothetical protein
MGSAYRILVGKVERKRPRGRLGINGMETLNESERNRI